MKKVLGYFNKFFKYGAFALLVIYFLCEIVIDFGNFASGVGGVFYGLFKLPIDIALVAVFGFATFKKGRTLFNVLLTILIIAFGFNALRDFPSSLIYFNSKQWTVIVYAIFDYLLFGLIALLFIVQVVFKFVQIKNEKVNKILGIVFPIISILLILFSIFVGIWFIASLITFKEFFTNYFLAFDKYFIFVPLMALSFIYLFWSNLQESMDQEVIVTKNNKKGDPQDEN